MSTTIESLELEILSNSKSAESGITALQKSLEKLKKATNGGVGLNSVNNQLKSIKGTLKDANSQMKQFSKSLKNVADNGTKSATSLLKFGVAALAIKKATTTMKKFIDSISDYIENVNLFTVAMGEYANDAKAYAETVSEVMGIDPGEWMRNQGIFQTLATGFGVAGDKAAIMSKNLTQLGYDISSFFNLDIDKAMEKLQSGLAGELEPLRRIGYDLSQAKLEAVALELGIDKSISSMTQAEKAMLRYYAIMTQVTTVHGDMGRTLEAPANQMRIFTAQIQMLARSIGSVLIPMLNKILPYLIAATKVLRELVSAVASLVGFEMPEVDYSGVDSMGNIAEDTNGALEEATESAKKLKSYMMGFDELNVINPDAGASDVSDTLGAFDFELPEYDFLGEATESRVAQIVKEMKEWLGITEDIDSWSELFDTRLGHILELVGLIGGGMLAWKVTNKTMAAIATIKALLASPKHVIAISVLVTILGITLAADGMKSAIKNGLDGFNFAEIVGGSLLTVTGAIVLGAKIAKWIDTAFKSSAVALAIVKAGINLGTKTVAGTGAAIAGAFAGIIVGIPAYFVGIYDACKEGIDWLNSLLIPAGATAAGAGIGAVIGMLGGPIGAGIGALIGLAVGLVTDLVILIVQKWDAIASFFKGVGGWFNEYVIQPIAGFFGELFEPVFRVFSNLWSEIKAVWKKVATWFKEKVIQPIADFFEGATTRISQFFEGCWIIIQALWIVVPAWFNEEIIQPIAGFFEGLWKAVSGFFKSLWNDIKAVWDKVAGWFDTWVIQPIVGFFKVLWESVSGFFSSLWEGIKEIWSPVGTWFNTTVIEPVKTVFKTACDAIGGFFSDLWLGIKRGVVAAMNAVIGAIEWAINGVISLINGAIEGFNKVVGWAADIIGADWGGITLIPKVSFGKIDMPTYEQGGFPESGQAFIARENGIPEMVGTIGRRTAVANNEQIVDSVANGVAEANSEQNALLREQNNLLRALLEKDSGVYLDGRSLSNSVEKYKREHGRVLIAGGAL